MFLLDLQNLSNSFNGNFTSGFSGEQPRKFASLLNFLWSVVVEINILTYIICTNRPQKPYSQCKRVSSNDLPLLKILSEFFYTFLHTTHPHLSSVGFKYLGKINSRKNYFALITYVKSGEKEFLESYFGLLMH